MRRNAGQAQGRAKTIARAGERDVHPAPECPGVVVSEHRIRRGGEGVGGFVGDHVDRTADGVAAVERALRPPQNFDAVDVVEFGIDRRRALNVDAVDVVSHRGVPARRGVLAAQAAHRNDVLAAGDPRAEAERWNPKPEILEPDDALGLQGLTAERGDGDGHLLQVFFTALGRDNQGFDFRDRGRGLGCLRRPRSCWKHVEARRGGAAQSPLGQCRHDAPPGLTWPPKCFRQGLLIVAEA